MAKITQNSLFKSNLLLEMFMYRDIYIWDFFNWENKYNWSGSLTGIPCSCKKFTVRFYWKLTIYAFSTCSLYVEPVPDSFLATKNTQMLHRAMKNNKSSTACSVLIIQLRSRIEDFTLYRN